MPAQPCDNTAMTARTPLKAILFDLDDTLWPIAPVIAQAEVTLHAWLAQHAPRVAQQFTIDELRARRMALLAERPELHVDLASLRRAGLQAAFAELGEDERHLDGAMRHFSAARNAVQLYDDVLPGLLKLKERLVLGTITNGNADLEVVGMAHHFKVSLAAAHFGSAKPDPAIFLEACRVLNVPPSAAVYVGDDLKLDVEGAQRAGLQAVWMNRRGSAALAEAEAHGIAPDAVCATFDELLDWLETQLAD
jgi:putative hydrolase of the HAD superfamily